MKIIKTSEALPKSGRYVLAWLEGAKIPMRAMWAAQHTLPLGDDADPEWGEYSEEKDEYFCPAGWYEMNQHEEQHWSVDGNVVAWCELPRLDHQCLAQIAEPAGAAPAAVAPQCEYPPLPSNIAHVTRRIRRCESEPTAQIVLEHAMHAYFDLGRQAAPALEAPPGVAGRTVPRNDDERAAAQFFADNPGAALLAWPLYLARDKSLALEAPAAPAPAVPDGWRLVPIEFLRGFGTLAHNYSLTAIAPDHYWGNERSAFSDAYARCGQDLTKLRDMLSAEAPPLAAAPQAPAARVGLPWRTGIPPWTDDRSVRVIAVTAHDDFGGVQVHDIRASDFHTDGDGDGAEVARVCTHWAYRDDIWPRADAAAPAAPAVDADPMAEFLRDTGPAIVWPKARDVGRIGDMSPSAHLRIGLDSDNDVYASIWDERGGATIEFCTPGQGGGKSSRTRMALLAVMVAMEADNAADPGRDWWAERNGAAQAKEGGDQ